jgi:hypothetical protein
LTVLKANSPGCPCCVSCSIDYDAFELGAVEKKWVQDSGTWATSETDGNYYHRQCLKTSGANAIIRDTTSNTEAEMFVCVGVYVASAGCEARVRFCWDTETDTWLEARYAPIDTTTGTLGLYWYDGASYVQLAGDVALCATTGAPLENSSGTGQWHWLRMTYDGDYVGVGFSRSTLYSAVPTATGAGLNAFIGDWWDDGEEAIWLSSDKLTALSITPTGTAAGLATGSTSGDVRFLTFLWRAAEYSGQACQTPNLKCHGQSGTLNWTAAWEQQTGTWTYDSSAGTMAAGAAGDMILWHRNFRAFDDSQYLDTCPIFDTENDVADFIFDWRDSSNYRFRRYTAGASTAKWAYKGSEYSYAPTAGDVYEVVGGVQTQISPGTSAVYRYYPYWRVVRTEDRIAWTDYTYFVSLQPGRGDVLMLPYSYGVDEPTRWGWRATTKTGTIKVAVNWSVTIGGNAYAYGCSPPGLWSDGALGCSDELAAGIPDTLNLVATGFTACAGLNGTWVCTRDDWTYSATPRYNLPSSPDATGCIGLASSTLATRLSKPDNSGYVVGYASDYVPCSTADGIPVTIYVKVGCVGDSPDLKIYAS